MRALADPALGGCGALLIGSVMLVGAGGNPIQAYAAMIEGAFGATQWRNTLIVAVPVVGMALAVAVPLRAGRGQPRR